MLLARTFLHTNVHAFARGHFVFLCALFTLAFSSACEVRVPLVDVEARFTTADATWFEEESTLFVFYRVEAEQGLSENSRVELTFRTDRAFQEFVDINTLPAVHTHERADCGDRTICGSMSIRVSQRPRDVEVRLRYHVDGELFLIPQTAFHIVARGEAHLSRSAIVYGVFNETNNRVQWRLRHQFPAIRNGFAQALGLRRDFRIENQGIGDVLVPERNPYAYGLTPSCPQTFETLGWQNIATNDRALFAEEQSDVTLATFNSICASAIVTDGEGEFQTGAYAQRNPEVQEAFPALQSPLSEVRQLRFLLELCDEFPDNPHRDMQKQRLFLTDSDRLCVEDFRSAAFADRFTNLLTDIVNEERVQGEDMVLMFAVHRERGIVGLAERLEQALAPLVRNESSRPSPHLSGVFVFDSFAHNIIDPDVGRFVLWCPASPFGNNPSATNCPIQANPPLVIGQVELNSAPILPEREQYEDFIEDFGVANGGTMESITIRAPQRTTISDNVPLGDFGLATFFNNEAISTEADDAFSFCQSENANVIAFRVEGLDDVFPLSAIGEVQEFGNFSRYELGLAWEFPFLMELQFETTLAPNVNTVDVVIPFGISTPGEEFRGSQVWQSDAFDLSETLLQCKRFCSHPTFDSAGVYNVLERFNPAYRAQCYAPLFPVAPGDPFPLDP